MASTARRCPGPIMSDGARSMAEAESAKMVHRRSRSPACQRSVGHGLGHKAPHRRPPCSCRGGTGVPSSRLLRAQGGRRSPCSSLSRAARCRPHSSVVQSGPICPDHLSPSPPPRRRPKGLLLHFHTISPGKVLKLPHRCLTPFLWGGKLADTRNSKLRSRAHNHLVYKIPFAINTGGAIASLGPQI